MEAFRYFNRDISWLTFNGRVLIEAANETVPLMERIRFLSIYSSNLDEFYRVRMPYLQKNAMQDAANNAFLEAEAMINRQQDEFGRILTQSVIPALARLGIHFSYKDEVSGQIADFAKRYFFTQIAGFLQPVYLNDKTSFFPENNQIYIVVVLELPGDREKIALVNIPVPQLDRFVKIKQPDGEYIIFLEDLIRCNLGILFPDALEIKAFNIKVTRDAELDLLDEDGEDMAELVEKQLSKRDFGLATRFLYEPGLSLRHLQYIVNVFDLKKASLVEGRRYHNLKDLSSLPVASPAISYPAWPAAQHLEGFEETETLFEALTRRDLMVHAPYQTYDTILRFFNEAAIDRSVQEIYTTMYRVAHDSKIAHALISAARNGKKSDRACGTEGEVR
ncbi:hypothetical protein [Dyadobacter sp. 676]|uniref:ATP-polyphosphate phosphotransferase n=1 Tax=Dyadobacter sp. 676 TaxID=3088362 RepID=A0AAU8FEU9_9BACT